MKTYRARFRNPGRLFWRKLNRVVGDGVEPGQFRWFLLEDDRMLYASLDAEVEFSSDRKTAIAAAMRRETGVQVPL